MTDEHDAKVQLNNYRALAVNGKLIEDAVWQEANHRRKGRVRRARKTYIVFPWEGEWHLINFGGATRLTFDTREAAEMVAVHRSE